MKRRQIEPIRDIVVRTLRGYGASDADIAGMRDTLLIRDGRYCGRSFRTPHLMAICMGNFVQFYDDQGELLGGVTIDSESRQRKAA